MGSWFETTMRREEEGDETTSFESKFGVVITPGMVMTFGIRVMAQKSSMEIKFNWSKHDDLDHILGKIRNWVCKKIKNGKWETILFGYWILIFSRFGLFSFFFLFFHRWVLQRKMNLGVMKIKDVVDTPSIMESALSLSYSLALNGGFFLFFF
ncbi:hypothetical protein TorRG33x02_005150, partial [Trema orientale]